MAQIEMQGLEDAKKKQQRLTEYAGHKVTKDSIHDLNNNPFFIFALNKLERQIHALFDNASDLKEVKQAHDGMRALKLIRGHINKLSTQGISDYEQE